MGHALENVTTWRPFTISLAAEKSTIVGLIEQDGIIGLCDVTTAHATVGKQVHIYSSNNIIYFYKAVIVRFHYLIFLFPLIYIIVNVLLSRMYSLSRW